MTHGESLRLPRVGQMTSKTTPVVMYFMFSLKDLFMTFHLLAGGWGNRRDRAVETAYMPFKIISHLVNRSLEALRVYEIILKCLHVIMHPDAKCYNRPPHCCSFKK